MRCLAFVAINLMCVVNDSDESKVNWYACVVACDVWRLPAKKYLCRFAGI